MKQFLLPDGHTGHSRLELTGEDFHYLCRVRRHTVGDTFPARDRTGARYHATLVEVGDSRCLLQLEPADATTPETGDVGSTRSELVLFQCLPKAKKIDLIIRQATEAGVDSVVPVQSEHSVVRLQEGVRISRKNDRWERVVREAVQQSGAPVPTRVGDLVPISELPEISVPGHIGLFFHTEPIANNSLHGYLVDRPRRVMLVIGPEGGLSRKEVQLLQQKGYRPVYLGPQVLRAETAALYAIAAVQTVLVEHNSWKLKRT